MKTLYLRVCLFLGKDYSRQRFSEWANKFTDVPEISDTIKKIDEICETRLFSGALSGDHIPSVAIFGLKNNHGWKDRTEVEQTTKQVYEHLTDEELEKERKRLDRIITSK
jgi:hypothetical protein